MKSPIVSICCITYNHEKFIEKTLEGFLTQKTDFPVEILIHDDASTDGTAKILNKYENTSSNISVVYQKENQYTKGKKPFLNFLFPKAKGKYIAMCEGDDLWTDPLKLQKQVDFLSSNEEFSACFTNAMVINEKGTHLKPFLNYSSDKSFTTKNVVERSGGMYPTASLVFRNEIKEYPQFMFTSSAGDYFLLLLLAENGKIGLLNQNTCGYRVHNAGLFTGVTSQPRQRNNFSLSTIEGLDSFNAYSNYRYDKDIKKRQSALLKAVLLRNNRNGLKQEEKIRPHLQKLNAIDKYSYYYQLIKDKLKAH